MSIHEGLNLRSPVVERTIGDEGKLAVCGAASMLLRGQGGHDVSQAELRRRAIALMWMVDPTVFSGLGLGEALEK